MRSAPPSPRRSSPARALWAGPGAARVLAGASAAGVVELALHPGGYVRIGRDGWLLVAVPSAPRGPLTLVVAGLEAAPLDAGMPARVMARCAPASGSHHSWRAGGETTLHVGEHVVSARGAPGAAPLPAGPLRPGWREALSAALSAAPPAPAALGAGLRALRDDALADAVLALAGRGEGLTPAGDDVLAGYAAWRHAAERPVSIESARCSPLGLAYLRCAQRGELAEPADAVLRAVRAGDAAAARRRAQALARWGSSSGAAMLWGMAAAA